MHLLYHFLISTHLFYVYKTLVMFDTLKPYQVAWQHLADLNDQFVYLFFCTYYTF